MVDTARHWLSMAVLERLLDGMAATKLNVLHWHISDGQAVPFHTARYPKLWKGAWSRDEKYSPADLSKVVELARLRGIRVELGATAMLLPAATIIVTTSTETDRQCMLPVPTAVLTKVMVTKD